MENFDQTAYASQNQNFVSGLMITIFDGSRQPRMICLENFKKPEKLHSMIVELNHAEEECDAIYLESALRVRDLNTDVLEIVAWREIYHCMESCADACEHVADSVETIVMKNT